MIEIRAIEKTTPKGGWMVRAVALLLVAAGLQAGSFRDLDTSQNWYFGTQDYSAAVLTESRKPGGTRAQAEGASEGEPAAGAADVPAAAPQHARPALVQQAFAAHAAPAAPRASLAPRLLPAPTGPPAA